MVTIRFMRGSSLIFPIILLGLLAALTYWVNINVQPPSHKDDAKKRHDPDYFLNNFVSTQTDLNGDLRYRLKADKMKHYPDDDSTDLVNATYTQYELGKKYVEVTGKKGEVSSTGADIKLYNDVVVTRAPYGDKGEMTLETEFLNILPEEDFVLTQKPVVIKQAPKTVVHARGMVYDKKNLRITLLNKVRAHYEKPNNKQSNTIDTLVDSDAEDTKQSIGQLKTKAAQPRNLPSKRMTKPQ